MAATFIRFYKTAISGILVLTLELNLLTVECIPICGALSLKSATPVRLPRGSYFKLTSRLIYFRSV